MNWTTALRTPDDVREEWAAYGAPVFATDEFTRSLDAVEGRMDVNEEHGTASGRDRVLERGAEALGWHVGAQPRNVRGCDQNGVCGYCGFGCALGAKRGTVETWLADAAAAGARVLVGVRAQRVLIERGAAIGVDAGPVQVRARAVVVACGAFHTPALLRRSGLANAAIGRNLRFHPVTLVVGEFEEPINSWEGTLQARYSEEHARLDGGYGVRYETAPVHPGFFGAGLQWDGARESLDIAKRYPYLAPLFPLVRDRDAGEVVVGGDGEPWAHYRLSPYDLRHVRAGFVGAARILEAAGAKRVLSDARASCRLGAGRTGCRAVPRGGGRARLGAEPCALRVRAHHGHRTGGRVAGDLCVRPDGRDVGGRAARRLRRVDVPDRVGGEPDDLDRRGRALERVGARVATGLVQILGVDVGGTFTDAVLLDGGELRTAKVSTARRQEDLVVAAARAVGADSVERFSHGTTVATNALLERKGARTAFVGTSGFEHLLHLRRQARAHLYRPCASHPEALWSRSSAASACASE